MFVTAFVLWLVAVHGLELTGYILFGSVIIDLVAWGTISNAFTAWATGEHEPGPFND